MILKKYLPVGENINSGITSREIWDSQNGDAEDSSCWHQFLFLWEENCTHKN
jgi:hypothetical protein